MLRSFTQVSIPLLLACAGALAPVTAARADALPYTGTLQLGRPLHPVPLTVTTGAQVALVSGGKKRVLPASQARDVTFEIVPIAPDGAVAIMRLTTPDGPFVGLLGGRSGSELLLFERADAVGDPGEQRTRELTLSGEPSALRTGVRYEGVSLCAERPVWFDAKRLDPNSLNLVAEPFVPATAKPEEATVHAAAAPVVPPTLSLLSAVASSELDPLTQLPRAPRTLVDDQPARGLTLQDKGFVQLRWEGGAVALQRLELELSASSDKPVELSVFSEQEVLHASLPARRGAQRVVIELPRPVSGRCLALRLDSAQSVELRELYAYTDLDREGGVDRLIASLVQDDKAGAAAVDVLEKLGPKAADRLATRWPELPARGKRRGLKLLARALPLETVRQRVLETALSDDPELRERAIAVLERGGEPGRVGLRQLALVPSETGDLSARALSTHAEELPALLAALAAEGGAERAALRKALATAARKDPGKARELATSWLAGTPSLAARAALALSFAGTGDRDFTASLADTQAPSAQTFEDRYRFALALAGATPSAAGDAWLTQQAAAEEWMLRSVALSALVLRGSSAAPALAQQAARDVYPRVRAHALEPLVAAGQAPQVEAALKADTWPIVRVEAARVLSVRAESRPALEAAISDSSRLVRRAAIDALASARSVPSWPHVAARLSAKEQSLEVREAAIGFARSLCVADARDALLKTAKLVLSPDASEDDNQAAVEALRALHDLGGEASQDGASVVSKDGGPELKKLWDGLPAPRCAGARPQARAPGVVRPRA